MKLSPKLLNDWPKLAWTARWTERSDSIDVYHGPMVEIGDGWCVEAVWAGDFMAGDFDRTDLVFGSGIRCRDNQVIFVSSGTAMDRLWYFQKDKTWFVSNSLAALSSCAGLSLIEDFPYASDRNSAIRTTWGAESCVRSFPTQSGEANLVWFNNLVYDGSSLQETQKPDTAPSFKKFVDYQEFLFEGARSLRMNLESPQRRHKVGALASISSGYDSPAAAVVAKHAGCSESVTIKQSSSFWRGSDSGEAIAKHLGLTCRSYNRVAKEYPYEEAFWAASGYCNLLNWTLFEYTEPVCLFFIGCYGDALWDRKRLAEPFTFEIWDDLAMSEYRLFAGMLQCAVPFWGMRHAKEISDISFSDEMEPWTMHSNYDRPIARRIVEEASVPRGSFALNKKNTSHEAAFRWPYSSEVQAKFSHFLNNRGLYAPKPFIVRLLREWAHLRSLLRNNIIRKLGVRRNVLFFPKLAGTSLLFHWANLELKQFYQTGLEESGVGDIRP